MQTVGIICEYNPFHNGHRKQFRMIREHLGEETAIVCLMSGNFVQRGEPALYHRSVRAEAAVRGGADLVLELPVTHSLRSAEGFASGGVEILSALGVCEGLSFGCEKAEGVLETAQLLLSAEFPAVLRGYLDSGISFAAARQRALEELGGAGEMVARPNNILGVEYCKAILQQRSRLSILPLQRGGDYHAQTPEEENPSATSLRAAEDFLSYVPQETWRCYENQPRYRRDFGERAMLARLRALDEEEFMRVPYGGEGLWSKVRSACAAGCGIEEILQEAKSKRYTYTRLSRLLLCAYLGVGEELLMQRAPYVRLLALSSRGRRLMRTVHKNSGIPVLHPGEHAPQGAFSALEQRAELLYDLFCEADGAHAVRQERVFCMEDTR